MKYYYIPNTDLYHHGIKGQRWGIRRFQDKSGRLTPAGRRRVKNQQKTDELDNTEQKKGLTDKQKRYIKIGAAAVGTALVAYGGYKIYKNKTLSESIKISKHIDIAGLIDAKTGLQKQSKPESIQKTLKRVNPKFSYHKPEYFMNCGNCGIAFEARMRGLDVQALGNPTGMTKNSIGQFFKGFKSESFKDIDIDTNSLAKDTWVRGKQVERKMVQSIAEQCGSESGRGMLFFPADFGSHWVSWVKDSNGVKFYNSQNPAVDLTTDVFSHYFYHRNSGDAALTSIRLDNLDINSDNIKNVITSTNNQLKSSANFDTFRVVGENFVTKYR